LDCRQHAEHDAPEGLDLLLGSELFIGGLGGEVREVGLAIVPHGNARGIGRLVRDMV